MEKNQYKKPWVFPYLLIAFDYNTVAKDTIIYESWDLTC